MDQATYGWAVTAVILLVAEIFLGTVYLLAWAAGLGVGAGVQWLTGSWALAAAAAAAVIAGGSLWARRVRAARGLPMADPDFGGEARLLRALSDGRWRVAFRGTEWDARIIAGAERAAPEASALVVGREANLLEIEIR